MPTAITQRSAVALLEAAAATLKQRGAIYGSAADHYEELAKLKAAYFKSDRSAHDVIMGNVLEKLDRIKRADPDSETFRDSIMDAINYLALAWEVSE